MISAVCSVEFAHCRDYEKFSPSSSVHVKCCLSLPLFHYISLSFHIIAPFLILNSYINSSSLSHQFSLKHLLDLYLGFFLSTDFHANRCSVHFSSDRKIPLNLRADLHKNLFIQRKLTGFYQTITLTFWPLYTDSAVEKNKNNLYLGR